jgi:hypothetical protein
VPAHLLRLEEDDEESEVTAPASTVSARPAGAY